MLRWLPATARGVAASIIIGLNTLLVCIFFIPFALVKLLIPVPAIRKLTDHCLIWLANAWVSVNHGWMTAVQKLDWHVSGLEDLNPRGWYLVSCNHQSWADIVILQRVLQGHIPFLKFFLKRELIYVPVIGFAWWALDFPFMRRGGKTLATAAADLATARKSCEKFRHIPTSVINFLEGTRFTAAKHATQHSPYQHLLKPKSGGAAIALATMGDLFNAMLDVTIVYPGGTPTFWQVMCGQMGKVVIEVKSIQIPAEHIQGAASGDPRARALIQRWLNDLWKEKDSRIGELLGKPAQNPEA
ncbi:acyltransferase [Uliginosibacterium gangwonense]|uniref:acyltransferase n=1 Tax=Uliginosibacterium gangwonense TaxID=392736 RepID=UPI00035D03B9|nr:acyltransferase [Uliginosibacterium gangwonense]